MSGVGGGANKRPWLGAIAGGFTAVVVMWVMGSCGGEPRTVVENEDAAPSPNASILPAPLSSAPLAREQPTGSGHKLGSLFDAGAPVSSRGPSGSAVASSSAAPMALPVVEQPKVGEVRSDESLTPKDALGVSLLLEWRWQELPKVAGPEFNSDAINNAKKATALRWNVHTSETGRMRVALEGRASVVGPTMELRARADVGGHLLLLPSKNEYRVVRPGAVRALLNERRLDVLPLAVPDVQIRGAVPNRFGAALRRVEMSTRVGRVVLDMAKVPESGLGAALLCRLLVELAGVDPLAATCARDELPIRAHYSWPGGGGVVVDTLELNRKSELAVQDAQCPPTGAQAASVALSGDRGLLLLTREEAASLRTKATEVVADAGAPIDGLWVRNTTEQASYLTLDGVTVAWLSSDAEVVVPGLLRGRYTAQWRLFTGELLGATTMVEAPGRMLFGAEPQVVAPKSSRLVLSGRAKTVDPT